MANKNEIIQIGDGIYQIKYYWLGMANVYMFLVVGEEKALLIDTGYSTTHALDYVRRVTDKPVTVVCTHGHYDHIGGNADFDAVYMSDKDLNTAKEHSDYEHLKRMMAHYGEVSILYRLLFSLPKIKKEIDKSISIAPCSYLPLPESGCFDLGGRKVTFIETPGHTKGSICLFDEKTKTLFPGDMLCEGIVILSFDHSTSVSEYRESVVNIRDFYRKNNGKQIAASHHQLPVNENIFERYIDMCDKVISGEVKGEYRDSGFCRGLYVKQNNLMMYYNEL